MATSGPTSGLRATRHRVHLRVLAAVLVCALTASCGRLMQSADSADAGPSWTGEGLVLVSCGTSGFGPETIELWELDPVTGQQAGHRPAVALPDGVRPAYDCSAPPALVRHLFNHDYSAMAVQVTGDDGGTRIGVLDLTSGQVRTHSLPPSSAFSSLPEDGFALYDETGRVLWYRYGADDTLVSFDPDAPRERAWVEHGPADPSTLAEDPEAAWWYYARVQALPDPSGRVAVIDDTVYVPELELQVSIFCTELLSGEVVTEGDCIPSDSTTGEVPDITPAAWVDDGTLLAFDGAVGDGLVGGTGGADTILRLEFDADYGAVSAVPALPASDWQHRSVVVSQTCQRFATLALRGDDLAIFTQDLYAGDAEVPATVAVIDREGSEATEEAPGRGAWLIDWVPAAEGAAACAP